MFAVKKLASKGVLLATLAVIWDYLQPNSSGFQFHRGRSKRRQTNLFRYRSIAEGVKLQAKLGYSHLFRVLLTRHWQMPPLSA